MGTYYCNAARPDDSGDGLSEATAKKTLAAGVGLFVGGGNLLYVKGGTNYTLTATVTVATPGTAAAGPNVIEGYATTPGDLGTSPVVTSSTTTVNLITITADRLTFRNLKFTHTGATRGAGLFPNLDVRTGITVDHCVFDGLATAIDGNFTVGYTILGLSVQDCEIKNCTGHGIANYSTEIIGCYIHDNAGDGFRRGVYSSQHGSVLISDSVFADNAKHVNYDFNLAGLIHAGNCVFYSASGSAIDVANTSALVGLTLMNNVFYENTGNTITASVRPHLLVQKNNAFKSTDTRRASTIAADASDITLTADPFNNAATGDFTINNAAGSGVLLRALGWPSSIRGLAGTSHRDVGVYQHQDSGGSAGYSKSRVVNA